MQQMPGRDAYLDRLLVSRIRIPLGICLMTSIAPGWKTYLGRRFAKISLFKIDHPAGQPQCLGRDAPGLLPEWPASSHLHLLGLTRAPNYVRQS